EAAFAGQQERARRLTGPAEKENAGKTHERCRVDASERTSAKPAAKPLPAQRAHRIRAVKRNQSDQEKTVAGLPSGIEQPLETEFAVDGAARMVNEKGQYTKDDDPEQELSPVRTHPWRA